MSAIKKRTIRRHRKRSDDGKGERRMIAGRRFSLVFNKDSLMELECRDFRIQATITAAIQEPEALSRIFTSPGTFRCTFNSQTGIVSERKSLRPNR